MTYRLWIVVLCAIAVLSGLALLAALSLPEKYRMTFALGVIAAPVIFFIRDKERIVIMALLLSLPLTMGLMLLGRLEVAASKAPYVFQVYLSDIFLTMLIVIQILKTLSHRGVSRYSFRQSRVLLPLLLWIGMGIISIIPAIDRTAACVGVIGILRMLLTFLCIFLYVKGRQEVHLILFCLLWVLLFQSLIIFVQYLTSSLVLHIPGLPPEIAVGDITEQGLRPAGTMGHSSHFAKFFGLLSTVVLVFGIFGSGALKKLFGLTVWACGSAALVLTIARAGIVTWFISGLFLAVGLIILRLVPARRVVLMCLVWVCATAVILYIFGGVRLIGRAMDDEGSSALRIPMWRVACNVIIAHPIIGVGMNNYTLVHQEYDRTPERVSTSFPNSPAHNLFLLYAAEMGIPGLIFFLWFIWWLLKDAIWCAKVTGGSMEKAIYFGIVIGVLALLLQSITGKGVVDHPIHLSLLSIFAACAAKQYQILKHSHEFHAPPGMRHT